MAFGCLKNSVNKKSTIQDIYIYNYIYISYIIYLFKVLGMMYVNATTICVDEDDYYILLYLHANYMVSH